MRIVVTGGLGFIGSNLCRKLVECGHSVAIIDNEYHPNWDYARSLRLHEWCQIYLADVRSFDMISPIFRGADAVIHLAAVTSVLKSIESPLFTQRVNILGALSVLEACRLNSVHRVIFASSAAVYGNGELKSKDERSPLYPVSPYAVEKLASERYLEVYNAIWGLRAISLRFFNVYGPGQSANDPYAGVIPKFLSRAVKGEPIEIYGDGHSSRDFIYVGDVVSAILKVIDSRVDYGTFNVGTGKTTSISDLARLVRDIMIKPVDVYSLPPNPGDVRMSVADMGFFNDFFGELSYTRLDDGMYKTLEYLLKFEV